jgi:hypothetical protein
MHEVDEFCKMMNDRAARINERQELMAALQSEDVNSMPVLEFFSESEDFNAWFGF